MWALTSLTRIGTCIPCTGRRIPNHWTTREVPQLCNLLGQEEGRNYGEVKETGQWRPLTGQEQMAHVPKTGTVSSCPAISIREGSVGEKKIMYHREKDQLFSKMWIHMFWFSLKITSLYFIYLFWPLHGVFRILVPQPGIKPGPPAQGAQSLNHRITREVPESTWFETNK